MRAQIDREVRREERKAEPRSGADPSRSRAASAAEMKPSVLVLSPPTAFATPRNWARLPLEPAETGILKTEVHCIGGGSLLLWLLFRAGGAPRLHKSGRVIIHGDIVVPTPQSCRAWAARRPATSAVEAAGGDARPRPQRRRRAAAAGATPRGSSRSCSTPRRGAGRASRRTCSNTWRAGRTPGA